MPDADIDSLVAGLRSARLTAEHSKNVQDDLFDRHATLIDAYRELSKSQQRADEASNSSTESPIIVLLIDANTCHFHDDLLRRRQRGGRDAAELLYQQALSVARKRKVPTSTCQVKIKCYGDLAALSKEGFRKGVAGAEGRCLAPFFFGFSSAFTGCEFIDVGEDIYERIAENTALYRSLPSCRHVIIAARPFHDDAWNRIAPRSIEHARQTTIITRREGAAVPARRGFAIEEFGDVFDWSELHPTRRSPDHSAEPCSPGFAAPARMSRHDHKATSRSPPQKGKSRIYSSQPPKVVGPEREGLIPVNKYDQRIDSPIPRLGGPTIERYNNIVPRPCNNKHLFGGCNDSACPYDHSVFDDEIIGIMRVQMRMYPCKERSICRRLGCLNSHMCQRCPGGQKAKTCRLPHAMHGIKTTVANMARAADCDVEEGEASIKMPMQSSFAEVEEKDDTVERGRSGGRSSLDASEPFGGVAIEGNGSEKMLLLEFSDDE